MLGCLFLETPQVLGETYIRRSGETAVDGLHEVLTNMVIVRGRRPSNHCFIRS